MASRCAVVGVGQTKHDRVEPTCRSPGSCGRPSTALADAGIEMADVDAIVIGKAPDGHARVAS